MSIFNEFFKKEKPVFTGLKFGFGSGGGTAGPLGALSISGGTVDSSSRSGWNLHIFTSDNDLVVSGDPGSIEVFIVGGGGGGGTTPVPGSSGGGGGGGGAVYYRPITVSPGTHPVVVGTYGNGNAGNNNAGPNGQGGNGGDSSITVNGTPYSAAGGGGGGGSAPPSSLATNDGRPGGSGGGGGNQSGEGAAGDATGDPGHPGTGNLDVFSPPVGWGHQGGDTPSPAASNAFGASGGGGATQGGAQGSSSGGADGGFGAGMSWISSSYGVPGPNGSGRYFAGGGGGSAFSNNGPGGGGRSGGGNGGKGPGHAAGAGSANTGGGGGGNSQGQTAGNGGTGIVIAMIPTA